MIRWPWVSRGRYEDMKTRAERAEAQVDALQEHFRRLDRAAEGLPEQPREPREEPEPIPDELRWFIESFDTAGTRRYLTDEVRRLKSSGMAFSQILERLESSVMEASA